MRKIKFRVWCVNKNEWEKDICVLSSSGEVLQIKNNHLISCRQDTHIVQQFTGLKDRNGKEIYEGDILDNAPQMIKVCWDSIGGKWFGHYVDKKRTSSFWMGNEFKNYKVIGNIYEIGY